MGYALEEYCKITKHYYGFDSVVTIPDLHVTVSISRRDRPIWDKSFILDEMEAGARVLVKAQEVLKNIAKRPGSKQPKPSLIKNLLVQPGGNITEMYSPNRISELINSARRSFGASGGRHKNSVIYDIKTGKLNSVQGRIPSEHYRVPEPFALEYIDKWVGCS